MASPFWSMTPQEGYDACYAYPAQRVFMDEAAAIVDTLTDAYQTNDMRFHRDDESCEKAVWMLHTDALDATRECISLLRDNRHTVASRLFRDILETLDLGSYFDSGTERSRNDLAKWYQDKFISHGRVREQIGRDHGSAAKEQKTEQYRCLSKFTHRTYKVLCNAYCLGEGDKMWFDWRLRKFKGVVSIPETVAQYLAMLGSIITRFVYEADTCKCVPTDKLRDALRTTVMVEVIAHHAGGAQPTAAVE